MQSTQLRSQITQLFNQRLGMVLRGQQPPAATPEPEPESPSGNWTVAREMEYVIKHLGEHRRADVVAHRHWFQALADGNAGDPLLNTWSTYGGWIARGQQVVKGAKSIKIPSSMLRLMAEMSPDAAGEQHDMIVNATKFSVYSVFNAHQTKPKSKRRYS